MKLFSFTLFASLVGCVAVGCSAQVISGGTGASPATTSGTSGTGGGDCGSISASSYDQSCTTDSDCAIVFEGSFCDACSCPNAAISASAVASYDEAFPPQSGAVECNCPEISPPVCSAGVCTLGHVGPTPACGTISASSFDQSCNADSDCVQVYEGSLCEDECYCGNAAINASAQASYDQAFASHTPGEPCECPEGPPPVCSAGTCQYAVAVNPNSN